MPWLESKRLVLLVGWQSKPSQMFVLFSNCNEKHTLRATTRASQIRQRRRTPRKLTPTQPVVIPSQLMTSRRRCNSQLTHSPRKESFRSLRQRSDSISGLGVDEKIGNISPPSGYLHAKLTLEKRGRTWGEESVKKRAVVVVYTLLIVVLVSRKTKRVEHSATCVAGV